MRFAFARNPSGIGWICSRGPWTAPLGTLLIFLTTVLMLLMPVTEQLADWDRFLRGGTDVEFTALAALLFTGLVLLAAHGGISPFLAPATSARMLVRSARRLCCAGSSSRRRHAADGLGNSPSTLVLRI